MRRLSIVLILCGMLLSVVNVLAQDNIPPAVDTVMTDLSQRLGKKIDRQTVNWTYSEELFDNAGLGCPQPGITYTPESIKGFIIDVVVDSITYDYRYSEKDNTFFLCSPQVMPTPTTPPIIIQQSPPTQTPLPSLTPQPTATFTPVPPQVAHIDKPVLAYVAQDGSVQITQMFGVMAAPIVSQPSVASNLDKLLGDPTPTYSGLRWSPDGTRLMFTDVPNKTLYLTGTGQAPIAISGKTLDPNVNAAWSADGNQIAYIASDGTNRQLDTIGPDGTLTPVTSIPACTAPAVGTNTSDLATVAFGLESGQGKLATPSALFWLSQDAYLLEEGSCLTLLGKSGAKWSVQQVTSVAVAPDHTHIVAVKAGALVSIDVASGNAQPVPGATQPADQVAWSMDGTSIIYSTVTSTGFTSGDPANTVGQQIFGAKWPLQAQSNTVSLWRIPAAGGTPTQFFSWEGYRIASISAVPDNSGVVVSFITSSATMLQWVAEGRSKEVIAAVAPHPELYSVRFDNPVPYRLAFAGQPAISTGAGFDPQIAQGEAPLPIYNQQCNSAPPSRLIIGQQAHVTPGDANSMRSSATGPVVGSIPGGSTITVLSGPVCSDKGVAWWQVEFKGIKGWTAEGQGSNYYVEP